MNEREGAEAAHPAALDLREGAVQEGVTGTGARSAGMLELREERAAVQIERVRAGQVQVSRQLQTRSETVTVELRRETLVLRVQPGEPAVMVGDRQLEPGETLELVLYDERAEVVKRPFLTEQVQVQVRTVTEQQQLPVELRREVLHVEQSGELQVNEVPGERLPER